MEMESGAQKREHQGTEASTEHTVYARPCHTDPPLGMKPYSPNCLDCCLLVAMAESLPKNYPLSKRAALPRFMHLPCASNDRLMPGYKACPADLSPRYF